MKTNNSSSVASSGGSKLEVEKKNQENLVSQEGSLEGKKILTTGNSPRKSLIPLPKEKQLSRQALTPIQKSGTSTEMEMVGRQKAVTVTPASSKKGCDVKASDKPCTKSSDKQSTKSSNKNSVKSFFKPKTTSPSKDKTSLAKTTETVKVKSELTEAKRSDKQKFDEKGIQTMHPDIELITGEEAPLSYWKQLAETRRQALEETLKENEELHNRVEYLEKENRVLEEMVEQAKSLAEIINSMSDDADESGFGGEADTTDYSLDSSST